MARRRKYRKNESIWEKYDWSMNPEASREIIAVVLSIFGLLLLLSILGIAGKVGVFLKDYLYLGFGSIGFLIPFIFVAIAVILWMPKKFEIKVTSVIGVVLAFIFVPALISPYGGLIGSGINSMFRNLIGPIGAFILLMGINIVIFLMIFNTSIRSLVGKFTPSEQSNVNVHGETQKVSVFTTLNNLKNKLGSNPKEEQIPVGKQPVKQPFTAAPQEGWEFPSLDLLETSTTKATSGNIAKNVDIIQKTLKDFGIDVSMGDVNIGPTVTQYSLKPKEGIKLNQIVARTNDLALALAAHPIRIEAPIPGKAAVGLELPNKVAAVVTLKEILESDTFKHKKSNLSIALGRSVAGNPEIIDIKKMPHLLIAGATGSGKSICINGIILSLVYQNTPSDLRMILVDPKRVEFTPYNGIPHLLAPVVTEPDKTINVLKWLVAEMERRFKVFQESHHRDIDSYNAKPPEGQKLPYIVVIIDELADLMAQSANEVEAAIVRLAQMARATGIHLIVATQRPSVDVITGLIKANIATRIAFAVASQIDSRTIIDQSGAEKLLGRGDMLYLSHDFGKPQRIQGVLVTDKEIKGVNDFLKREGNAVYDESILNYKAARAGAAGANGQIDDEMYEEAKQTVINAGRASASLLQRRLRVGYARAARLLDILEEQGVIGPAEGAKPRDVLVGFDDAPPNSSGFSNNYNFGSAPKSSEQPINNFKDDPIQNSINNIK
jgi:S-DNA-T family DNA segregation ATPase FtsK/SpoIIIE